MITRQIVLKAIPFALLSFAAADAWCDTTYSYTSPNYPESAIENGGKTKAKFTTAMKMSGSFTLARPLSPNLHQEKIAPSIKAWNFSNGLKTYTQENAQISAVVSTNSRGDITRFAVSGKSPKGPYSAKQRVDEFFISQGGSKSTGGSAIGAFCKDDAKDAGTFCDTEVAPTSSFATVDLPADPVFDVSYDTPSNASGGITFGAAKLDVKYAAAFAAGDGTVYVYLTRKPLDVTTLTLNEREVENGIDKQFGAYVRIPVKPDGAPGVMWYTLQGLNVNPDRGKFELRMHTAKRIEGSWIVDKPDNTFSKPFQFDLKWAADVVALAK